jgi:hypothetical protein
MTQTFYTERPNCEEILSKKLLWAMDEKDFAFETESKLFLNSKKSNNEDISVYTILESKFKKYLVVKNRVEEVPEILSDVFECFSNIEGVGKIFETFKGQEYNILSELFKFTNLLTPELSGDKKNEETSLDPITETENNNECMFTLFAYLKSNSQN